jgi:hypothetical protein
VVKWSIALNFSRLEPDNHASKKESAKLSAISKQIGNSLRAGAKKRKECRRILLRRFDYEN